MNNTKNLIDNKKELFKQMAIKINHEKYITLNNDTNVYDKNFTLNYNKKELSEQITKKNNYIELTKVNKISNPSINISNLNNYKISIPQKFNTNITNKSLYNL